jgi:hypothetical protein
LADLVEGVVAGVGDVVGCGVCLRTESSKLPDYPPREMWVTTSPLAERMNRLRASQTKCFRPFRCATLCLWQQATDTTEGRLSYLSIISSGYLADAARCWSEPSRTGLKRCSARKPKSFPSRLSILPSSPTTCTCLSMRLRLWRLVSWSTGSRATPRGCFGKSSLTFGRCRPCGPRRTLRQRRAECRRRRFTTTSKLRARGPE